MKFASAACCCVSKANNPCSSQMLPAFGICRKKLSILPATIMIIPTFFYTDSGMEAGIPVGTPQTANNYFTAARDRIR